MNGIVIGIIIGLVFGWKVCAWWHRSSLKKATDAVGSATKKPGQVAKDATRKATSIFKRFFGNKDDKEKKP